MKGPKIFFCVFSPHNHSRRLNQKLTLKINKLKQISKLDGTEQENTIYLFKIGRKLFCYIFITRVSGKYGKSVNCRFLMGHSGISCRQ